MRGRADDRLPRVGLRQVVSEIVVADDEEIVRLLAFGTGREVRLDRGAALIGDGLRLCRLQSQLSFRDMAHAGGFSLMAW